MVDNTGYVSSSNPTSFITLLHDEFFSMSLCVAYRYPGDITEVEQAIPGIAAITDARLIIEGTAVPEPTSALLILPASLILTRRIRRPCVG
jgi:hypothetical protein